MRHDSLEPAWAPPMGAPDYSKAYERFRDAVLIGDIEVDTDYEWQVKGVLPLIGLAVVYGPPGCGKSFFAIDLGCHIAGSRDWRERRVEGGAVIYLAAEGQQGMKKRLLAARRHLDLAADTPLILYPGVVNMRNAPEDIDLLVTWCRALMAERLDCRVTTVVIDTLNRSMAGGDENNSVDMGGFIANCGRVAGALDCLMLVVHHSGKDASAGLRGHSSLHAAADAEFAVEKITDGVHQATLIKSKDGEDGLRFGFNLRQVEVGTDIAGDPITTCVVDPTDAPALQPRSGLPGNQRQALDILINTIAKSDELLPDGLENAPSAPTRGVRMEQWRDDCKDRGLGASETAEAFRSAFRRARTALAQKGHIAESGGWVWAVRD